MLVLPDSPVIRIPLSTPTIPHASDEQESRLWRCHNEFSVYGAYSIWFHYQWVHVTPTSTHLPPGGGVPLQCRVRLVS